MSSALLIQAGCCCPSGEVCFAHYINCQSGFQRLSIRYPNGCPQVHPPVIYVLAGDPELRCFYFDQEIPQGVFPVLDPSEILAVFPDCESCGPAQPQTGACCLPNGDCITTTAAGCATARGNYQGDNTTCDHVDCPPPPDPVGACCTPGGGCSDRTQSACAAAGGTWLGQGSSCTPNPCTQPPPTGACCTDAGECTVVTQVQCANIPTGNWLGPNTNCSECPPVNPPNTVPCCFGTTCAEGFTAQACVNAGGVPVASPSGSCIGVECGPLDAPSFPSRGLGDTVVKALRFIGVRL